MTTMPHGSTIRRSVPLPPERSRDLVLALERSGVETGRVSILAVPARSMRSVSRVDRRTMTRPLRRVGLGVGAGIVIGLAIAVALILLGGLATGPTLVALAVGGTVIGGLFGLYSGLPMNTELADVDTGQRTIVEVDVVGLDHDEVAEIDGHLIES